MNILTDKLPEKVRVGDDVFELNTDYRAGIEFEIMVEKGEDNNKALLKPFFYGKVPDDLAKAATAALWFYSCGAVPKGDNVGKNNKQTYSFDTDAQTICADFRRFYGIDLSGGNYLHWWTFRALLFGLPEDSGFKTRIYYRTCKLSDLPKKERARIASISKSIEIKSDTSGKMTLVERNEKMRAYVLKRNKETEGV